MTCQRMCLKVCADVGKHIRVSESTFANLHAADEEDAKCEDKDAKQGNGRGREARITHVERGV